MNQLLSSKLYAINENLLAHWCPACDGFHLIFVNRPNHFQQQWMWNNDPISPSFRPDLGVFNRCHYRITDGIIDYLPDCNHLLVNQAVPMPDIPTYIADQLSVEYFSLGK